MSSATEPPLKMMVHPRCGEQPSKYIRVLERPACAINTEVDYFNAQNVGMHYMQVSVLSEIQDISGTN